MVEKTIKSANLINIPQHLTNLTIKAIEKAFQIKNFPADVKWTTTGSSDLCSPSAVKIYNMNSKKENFKFSSCKEVAEEIVKNFPSDELVEKVQISTSLTTDKEKGKTKEKEEKKDETKNDEKEKVVKKEKKEKKAPENYFIDFYLSNSYLKSTGLDILRNGINLNSTVENKIVVCDFSSPNIAKEMHVGHLRSTIIGESICRILEHLKAKVHRVNHVGDWGTQFGMLIANLEEVHPDFLTNKPEISELEAFYVQSKSKFDDEKNPDFKKRAYENTVKLQTGDEKCRAAWKFICDASRNEFEKIYKRLNITLNEFGESFYDPICRELIPQLEKEGHVILDDGMKIMRVDGYKAPLIIVKSDGGFTYDSTDIAAVKYRLVDLKADWIIYVIGSEQNEHVTKIAKAAEQLGYHIPSKTRIDHMGFGLMLNKEGKKFSTRMGGLIKLVDLLDAARDEAKTQMITRFEKQNWSYSQEELIDNSEKIGYSAVRYFDLKQTRESSYKFSYDLILNHEGNTAVYLFYNYVRMCSLQKKINMSLEDIEKIISQGDIKIEHEKERALLISLMKLQDTMDDILTGLCINRLSDYVYEVCVKFSEFFDECRIIDSKTGKVDESRVLIVELSKKMLKLGFDLLGLTPVERI